MGARGQAEQAVTEMEAEGTGGTEVDRGDDRVEILAPFNHGHPYTNYLICPNISFIFYKIATIPLTVIIVL